MQIESIHFNQRVPLFLRLGLGYYLRKNGIKSSNQNGNSYNFTMKKKKIN